MEKREKGAVLVITLIILVVLAAFMVTLTFFITHESKWVVKLKKKSVALQLAEAGVDRGVWKLNESKAIWDNLEDGPITGYNNDVVYTDVEGGSYKILISTTDNFSERKIIATGMESSGSEVKKIEVVMAKQYIQSSITAPNIVFGGNCKVHWGPISSLTTMSLSGSADNPYPRKYSRGGISSRDTDPAPPNTDDVEYWAYYNVPDPPEVDFNYYRNNADEYYPGDKEFKNRSVSHASADCIYYVEGNATLKNSYLKGTLIVMGNLNLGGNGAGSYSATVPSDAWKEYAKIDTVASGEYAGDNGYQAVSSTYAINKVAFEGYIYVGGNISSSGTPTINGVVVVAGSSAGVGNLTMYYSSEIALNVQTTNNAITRTSWKQSRAEW